MLETIGLYRHEFVDVSEKRMSKTKLIEFLIGFIVPARCIIRYVLGRIILIVSYKSVTLAYKANLL